MLKSVSLFLLAFFVAGLQLCASPFHYENQLIEKIDVTVMGADDGHFDAQNVKSRIKTKESDLFSQTTFDVDLKLLARDFDRIEPHLSEVNGKLHISLKVWHKPRIRAISWEGNRRVKTKQLQSELGIQPGAIFHRQAFNEAFHKVKAYYVKEGFFQAQLEYAITQDPSTNEVEITIYINEGDAGRVKKIVFKNFTQAEECDLVDIMLTKEFNALTSWMSGEGTYHEQAVQQDEMIILNYLHDKGYADAKVEINAYEARAKDRIILCVTATKGPRYHVGKISFTGNTLFCDDEIQKQFRICEGDHYSPEAIRATVARITGLYGKHGYIDASVDYEPKLEYDENCYSIDFTIEEGEQFRVGLIKVFGNNCTQTRVILHEILLCPGEVFNAEKLQHSEERLRCIGYFDTVNVYAVRSSGICGLSGNYRDVHIEVTEANTGNFGLSVGYSTAESAFLSGNLTERNFNIAGLTTLFTKGLRGLRGGGEYANLSATFGKKSRSYVFSWTKPHFMDTPWIVGFDIERSNNRYISDDYDINANGITLHASYRCNEFVKVGTHYRLRDSDITFSSDANKKHLVEQSGDWHYKWNHPEKAKSSSPPPSSQEETVETAERAEKKKKEKPYLYEEVENGGTVSALGIHFNYDSTNHPVKPSCGFRSGLALELAGVGGNHIFFGMSYLNSYFYPIGSNGIFKIQADFKFIDPFKKTTPSSLPIDERIFLGGDNLIRGYQPFKLGPKFKGGEPRGGISMHYLSAEYSHCFFPILEGFVFIDSGSLTDNRWRLGKTYTAAGFGCRIKVLASGPPLTIGMGYPLNSASRSDVKKFFLNVGGKF